MTIRSKPAAASPGIRLRVIKGSRQIGPVPGENRSIKLRRATGPRPSGMVELRFFDTEAAALAVMAARLLQGESALLRGRSDEETIQIVNGLMRLQAAGIDIKVRVLRSTFHVVDRPAGDDGGVS